MVAVSHQSEELDLDPHKCEKQDPNPDIKVKSWIRIRIRIRIKAILHQRKKTSNDHYPGSVCASADGGWVIDVGVGV
jgi:hypothetical protein